MTLRGNPDYDIIQLAQDSQREARRAQEATQWLITLVKSQGAVARPKVSTEKQ
jgi:hypothetical protein